MKDVHKYDDKDRHSALKTEQVGSSTSKEGVKFLKIKLQWSREDFGFSFHAIPSSYSLSGMQTTDFLAYLGFERGRCAFAPSGECYSTWIPEDFDVGEFSAAFDLSYRAIKKAKIALEKCGYFLRLPEGLGYFFSRAGRGVNHRYRRDVSADGHTSPKSSIMKTAEDRYFKFALSWIEGGDAQGWIFHYAPKHPPLSPEFDVIMRFLGIKTFDECPHFEFRPCYWKFMPFESSAEGFHNNNVEIAHRWFDAHPENFGQGIESLLSAQSHLDKFDMSFLPFIEKKNVRIKTHIERNIGKSRTPYKQRVDSFDFDVAISFATTERQYAEELAKMIRDAGFDVFYDDFYPEQLWGRDLIVFFDQIYRKQSKYCVIFVSTNYCERMWTNHERRSAQARALQEKGKEYILPIRVDNSELPGMPSTVGFLSLQEYNIDEIATILIRKLKQ